MKEIILKKISDLSKELIIKLNERNLKISFAESMTGGLLSSSLTKEKNASKILESSFVVYSNKAKMKILGVEEETVNKYKVYSQEVVKEMLSGLEKITEANVLIAVSGIAGPDSILNHEIGETWIGFKINDLIKVEKKIFSGNREMIQFETAKYCFEEVLNNI